MLKTPECLILITGPFVNCSHTEKCSPTRSFIWYLFFINRLQCSKSSVKPCQRIFIVNQFSQGNSHQIHGRMQFFVLHTKRLFRYVITFTQTVNRFFRKILLEKNVAHVKQQISNAKFIVIGLSLDVQYFRETGQGLVIFDKCCIQVSHPMEYISDLVCEFNFSVLIHVSRVNRLPQQCQHF